MESDGLIGREETEAGALVEHHIFLVKLVSFIQVSSTLRKRVPFCSRARSLCANNCRRTRQRSELPWKATR